MAIRGRHPGDRRVGLPRVPPTAEHLEPIHPARRRPRPGLLLLVGFLLLIGVGTVLLALPISSQDRAWTPLLDALFTATSAASVAGLSVVSTADHWSAFGQIVILLVVQAGGFGIMAGSTFLLLLLGRRRRVGLGDRIAIQESTGELQLGGVLGVVRTVALFSLAVEAIGAIVLTVGFLVTGEAKDLVQGVWWGVFHAVSSFNNAGFDLLGPEGFVRLRGDWLVLVPIAVLIIIGALGFAVVAEVTRRRGSLWRLSVEARLVLLLTGAILLVGWLAFMVLEWDSPETLGALPLVQRPFTAAFETISLRTAGFSTLPVGSLGQATMFVLVGMMFIGGASASTSGGIKVNTFGVLLAALVATARGDSSPSAFGRRFSTELVYRAMAVALLSVAFLFVAALALDIASPAPFISVLFESVSAFATAGGSSGVTAAADPMGRVVLIITMFCGRLGPLTLALVLATRFRPAPYRYAVETIRIG
jgi:trk system potassium uptake protein TrkH